jgi:hypothetical protein
VKPVDLAGIDSASFLKKLVASYTKRSIEELLRGLPIADEHSYEFNASNPERGWTEGRLHWYPIGAKRGNAGQIALAKRPINPIAERLINGMEAIIELRRQEELKKSPDAPAPSSPREAVKRYFGLPPLDEVPDASKEIREQARNIARLLLLSLQWNKQAREFALTIRDQGIGQAPGRIHKTLLSLGESDKGDKPYLIGVFGQGGSSTYAASKYSWIVSRRKVDLLEDEMDSIGFSIVKHIYPKGRRDHYFAYLAAHPDGRVPRLPVLAAQANGFEHGSWFGHVDYDFGQSQSAITRGLYQALNHVLYNPVLPFDTNVSGTVATIYGNGYRLSNLNDERKDLDKRFEQRVIA